jgi:hypothetical protein
MGALMSFNYSVQLNDPTDAGGAADAVLVYDLQQALGVWSRYISGIGTLVVNLDIADTPEGRESGGPTSSHLVGTNAQGLQIWEPSSLYELTTGQHVSGTTSDITITVSPPYFQYLDLAPNLTYASQVPNNEYNPIVVFLHELTHGFGWSGWYSQTGVLPGNYESTFDAYDQITQSGAAYFTGPNAEAAYGGPVRLTTSSTAGENYYHVGNTLSDLFKSPSTVQDPLTLDLMNGVVLFFDYQYPISNLDLAVLKDLGYQLTRPAPDDLNGDRTSDILFRNDASGDTGFYQVSNGTFAGWHDIAGSNTAYSAAGTGDFYGTGTADILFRNNATGDTGFYQIDNGAFAAWHDIGGSSPSYSVMGTGDFYGNGTSDILFRNNATGDTGFYAMSMGAMTGWHDIGGSSTSYSIVGTGDFYGNGTDDVLFRNNVTGDIGYYAISNGAFAGWHDVGASSPAYSVVGIGDFDGSGSPDILFRNSATGDIGYYKLSNGAFAGWHDIGSSSTAYSVVGVGDYNGDLTSDILFRNSATGDTGYYQMSKGVFAGWHDIGPSSTAYKVLA